MENKNNAKKDNEFAIESDGDENDKTQQTNQESQNNLCKFFSKHGHCKFGQKCKFIHQKNEISANSNRHQKNSEENVLNNSAASSSSTFKSSKVPCRYFKVGSCQKGDQCQFVHSFKKHEAKNTSTDKRHEMKNPSTDKRYENKNPSIDKRQEMKNPSTDHSHDGKTAPICWHYQKGYCRREENCWFEHQQKDMPNDTLSSQMPINNLEINDNHQKKSFKEKEPKKFNNYDVTFASNDKALSVKDKVSSHSSNAVFTYDLISITKDDLLRFRDTEIEQFKKRFPNYKMISENTFLFHFHPSDPDWPFDVKSLNMEVNFSEHYPLKACKISIPQSPDQMPPLLVNFLNKSILDWLTKKFEASSSSGTVELVFRPFLKWLDKSLEALFIQGLRKVKQDVLAKEAGIEFVPAENIHVSTCIPAENNKIIDDDSLNSKDLGNSTNENISNTILEESSLSKSENVGTKIIFLNLELTEGTASLICTKLSITLRCGRCKTSCDLKLIPKKDKATQCTKCNIVMGFLFEPSLLHQFSNLVGLLHLTSSQIIDVNLMECSFTIDCLNCSKQVIINGIHYSQRYMTWCIYCNKKLVIFIGSVKFISIQPVSILSTIKNVAMKKDKKPTKDPVLQEGEPLPNYGTCKHYKKSYRWLRFPCCGRIYPCDICHNEKEIDHEMKYASRMICGFCAKEQTYSVDKPCISCSANMTKKASSHWEGGKGCRNKIQMSREDKQKYSGVNKTISRKAQNLKPVKKK